jgi:MFS family permease
VSGGRLDSGVSHRLRPSLLVSIRSRFRKEAAYASLILGAILVGVIGPLLIPDFGNILVEYDLSLTQVIALNGYLVLTYGISSFVCVSLSDATGRRPIYLLSNLILGAGIIWGATGMLNLSRIEDNFSSALTFLSLFSQELSFAFGCSYRTRVRNGSLRVCACSIRSSSGRADIRPLSCAKVPRERLHNGHFLLA